VRPLTLGDSPSSPRAFRHVRTCTVRRDAIRFDRGQPTPTADGKPLRLAASVPDPHSGAFETAYATAWLPVFRFALAWTNDLVGRGGPGAEAFLRLWDRRTEVDWSVPVLPWLLVSTRRTATDRFRRLRRALSIRARSPSPQDLTPVSSGSIFGPASARWSALERSALVLTALEDLDAAKAGAILGIEANAVRSAASRGRRKLKEQR